MAETLPTGVRPSVAEYHPPASHAYEQACMYGMTQAPVPVPPWPDLELYLYSASR